MRSFRNFVVLSGAVLLAACGGDTAPQTVGSVAPPAGGSPGSGGGVGTGGGTTTPTPTPANFLDVTSAATFDAIGGFQALDRKTDATTGAVATLYTGNAATVGAPSGTISYDPRDGVFTLKVADTKANVSRDLRFQDPAHRTEYSSAGFAARQLPNLSGFNYLEVFDGTSNPVFFYQRPGTQTTYVSLGGYSRTAEDVTAGTFNAERGVFVFGQKTAIAQVPAAGSGTYEGGMLASMVNDPSGGNASYLQWINGTSKIDINFATGKVDMALAGTVGPAFAQGGGAVDPTRLAVGNGSTFRANGTAQVDLIRSGGFAGVFRQNVAASPGVAAQQNVGFTDAAGTFLGVDFASVSQGLPTAGASSIDGAFFGPGAINVGGNFRIIGGVPNQRIDIQGAFTGAKK
ncbi:hypothetical protein [Sphingomonas sp. M1-B02]|uniref:hypothetical protein n=1 Tax=Sphingomonas sp. M1-B02 TaxID=3114300 RepID=UPI00223FB8EC|nr:hypothetical protein [Sphingomonas sp. S6-11]UZK66716.1 hypothetical protein OKW87_02430 [Sphingomonas sp. S6-11]